MRKEEYPCVSTSSIRCVCVCVCGHTCFTGLGEGRGKNAPQSDRCVQKCQNKRSDSERQTVAECTTALTKFTMGGE